MASTWVFQIVRKPRVIGARWSFVAHGATYTKADANEMRETIARQSGDLVRLLPVRTV